MKRKLKPLISVYKCYDCENLPENACTFVLVTPDGIDKDYKPMHCPIGGSHTASWKKVYDSDNLE